MAKILIIDPPSGWRYGFPKHYDNPDGIPVKDWLLANGYPQWEIDANMYKHCRYWEWDDEVEGQQKLQEKMNGDEPA